MKNKLFILISFCVSIFSAIAVLEVKSISAQNITQNISVDKTLSNSTIAQIIMNKPGKYGFINRTSDFVVSPQFDSAGDFFRGLSMVKVGCKYGFINRKGEIAIPLKFEFATPFIEELSLVQAKGELSYIDNTGKNCN